MFSMGGDEEISQDLTCLFFGIFVAVFSTAVVYAVRYIRSRNSKISEVKNKLKFKSPLPKSNSKEKHGMMLENQQRMRASASPFSLVQLHNQSKIPESDGNWKSPVSKEVEVNLDIRKSNSANKSFDVQMGIIVDPESKEPLNIQIDGQVDREMNVAQISGKAKSEVGGSVEIEGQLDANKGKMNLDTKKTSTNKMVLRSKRK